MVVPNGSKGGETAATAYKSVSRITVTETFQTNFCVDEHSYSSGRNRSEMKSHTIVFWKYPEPPLRKN